MCGPNSVSVAWFRDELHLVSMDLQVSYYASSHISINTTVPYLLFISFYYRLKDWAAHRTSSFAASKVFSFRAANASLSSPGSSGSDAATTLRRASSKPRLLRSSLMLIDGCE